MAGEVVVPGCLWQPSSDVKSFLTRLDAVIVHTRAGGGVTDHYHIDVDGYGNSIQFHDLRRKSKASVDANPFSIAIVGRDTGAPFPAWSGSDVPPFTVAQRDEIIRILRWILDWSGLPRLLLQTSCLSPTNQGIGWHRLGIDGNFPPDWPYWGRRSGCQHWSTSIGKACPGTTRITQIVEEIYPALTTPPPQEPDMPARTDTMAVMLVPLIPPATPVPKLTYVVTQANPAVLDVSATAGFETVAGSTATGRARVRADGGVFVEDGAPYHGGMHRVWTATNPQPADEWIVDGCYTPTADGYWLLSNKGGLFAFGLAKPTQGAWPTPSAAVALVAGKLRIYHVDGTFTDKTL